MDPNDLHAWNQYVHRKNRQQGEQKTAFGLLAFGAFFGICGFGLLIDSIETIGAGFLIALILALISTFIPSGR